MRASRPARALAAAAVVCWAAAAIAGPARGQPASDAPARPDAEVVRQQVQEILADPRYSPRKSLLQWLVEKFEGWEGPDGLEWGWLGPLGRVVFWIVVIWCLLALVAILGHVIWGLWVTLRPAGRGARIRGAPRFRPEPQMSYGELERLMGERAEGGQFREAIGLMMSALIRWLDGAGVVRFHRSKTNGDYVRECRADLPAAREFRRFALTVDAVVYGGMRCRRADFERMRSLFEHVQRDVRQRAKD